MTLSPGMQGSKLSVFEIEKEFERLVGVHDLDKTIKDRLQKMLTEIKSKRSRAELFIAILGEFNAGKSTFINQILSTNLLTTSDKPCTPVPIEIHYGDALKIVGKFSDGRYQFADLGTFQTQWCIEESAPPKLERISIEVPSQFLKINKLCLIDTPGTNSGQSRHEDAAIAGLKMSDAALFMVYSHKPGGKTTVDFLKKVTEATSTVQLVISKSDDLNEDQLLELQSIHKYFTKQIGSEISVPWFFSTSINHNKILGPATIGGAIVNFAKAQREIAINNKTIEFASNILHSNIGSVENRVIDLEKKLRLLKDENPVDAKALLGNISKPCEEMLLKIEDIVRTYADAILPGIEAYTQLVAEALDEYNFKTSLQSEFPEVLKKLNAPLEDALVTLRRDYIELTAAAWDYQFSEILNRASRIQPKVKSEVGFFSYSGLEISRLAEVGKSRWLGGKRVYILVVIAGIYNIFDFNHLCQEFAYSVGAYIDSSLMPFLTAIAIGGSLKIFGRIRSKLASRAGKIRTQLQARGPKSPKDFRLFILDACRESCNILLAPIYNPDKSAMEMINGVGRMAGSVGAAGSAAAMVVLFIANEASGESLRDQKNKILSSYKEWLSNIESLLIDLSANGVRRSKESILGFAPLLGESYLKAIEAILDANRHKVSSQKVVVEASSNSLHHLKALVEKLEPTNSIANIGTGEKNVA